MRETCHERLHSKLKMVILGMPQITIIKIVNLVKKVVGESMASKKYFNKVQDEQKNKESNYDSDEEP
jgi:hypothetical protein